MSEKKTYVLDLDDTLFKVTKTSRFFFKLANRIFLLGFRFEKVNKGLLKEVRDKRVIILTGRADDWMKKITFKQLKKNGNCVIFNDRIIMCPRGELYMNWKKEQVEKLKKEFPDLIWRDDDNE